MVTLAGGNRGSAQIEQLLEQQIAFYRADAAPYEAWSAEVFARGGGGPYGAACRRDRQSALGDLGRLGPLGEALELAAGTGSYTGALLASADHLTAIDASAESLALARAKLAGFANRLTLVEADIFRWHPVQRYDTVFFSYWLSHVPSSLFEPFWHLVSDALAADGQVFLIDTRPGAQSNPGLPGSSGADYREHDDPDHQVSTRELNGRVYRVVKVAWRPADLEARLSELGWQARLVQGEISFWGTATRRAAAA